MSKAFQNRQKARMYAVIAYRNLALLEDRHSDCEALDEPFFHEMRKALADSIVANQVAIDMAVDLFEMSNEEIRQLYEGKQEMIDQTMTVIMHVKGNDWDNPVKVRDRFAKENSADNISAFVLNGEFEQRCLRGEKPTDAVMCALNHDVYNRFYTLVCRGIL